MASKEEIYEPVDLTEILKGYEGKWVILSEENDKVLKSGDTLDELENSLNLGIVMLVPQGDYLFVPNNFA